VNVRAFCADKGDDTDARMVHDVKYGIMLFIRIIAFLIIYFIFAIKKFYARKENNTVCIDNIVLSDTYVLSKIKANY
jgi:hypothetical protein